ncbi:MAG: 2-alkenal reductase [Thermomicrobiales bacterium]|nr:2-alkenal reductase [Thermomicrobiales bacterium]
MRARNLFLIGLGCVVLLCVAGAMAVSSVLRSGDDDEGRPGTETVVAGEPTVRGVAFGERSGTPARTGSRTVAGSGNGGETGHAVEVVARVGSGVVTVLNEQRGNLFGGSGLQPAGSGTGFIVDNAGHIVTNWHVVDGGDAFAVLFADGTSRPAHLVGADPTSDLAVVQVEGAVPAVIPLGDSSLLQPGEPVLAIGSPLGSFTNTVTQGIVSALGRSLSEQPGQPELTGLIQHDAAINPGNSGGPLINLAGEVVGVNTLGIPEENGRPIQGLFFAIPSNRVKEIAGALIETGHVEYPYVGIELIPVTEQLASQEDLPVTYGIYVYSVVSDGPADRAGLRPGDIVLSLNGVRIDERHPFTEVLFEHQPGDTVQAEIRRGDETLTADITLDRRPENP